jgi:hypothetical protein
MKYLFSQGSLAVVSRRKPSASVSAYGFSPVERSDAAAQPHEDGIANAAQWKRFNWNMALGLATMLAVSAAGWTVFAIIISSLWSK